MSKEMLDVLVDQKKVEEIVALPTKKDVESKLNQEGVDVTSEDVRVLGEVFKTVAEKGPEAADEKLLASVSGGMGDLTKDRLKKAGKAQAVIGRVVGAGVAAHQGYKHKNTIKSWFNSKEQESGSGS